MFQPRIIHVGAKTLQHDIDEYLKNDETTPLILNGCVSDVLKFLPNKSIDLIITSPPYWQQRDYKIENQIGKE
jgi:DNA modification methylase